MNALIIYDSQFGNTQTVADTIALAIKGKSIRVLDFNTTLLKGIDLLIVGCPIHGWRPSEGMLTFLTSLHKGMMKGICIATFDTRFKSFFSGSASPKILKQLIALGGTPVSRPEKFYVNGKEGPLMDGELERAKKWAGGL